MRANWTRAAAAATIAAVAALGAGCGSDDDAGGDDPARLTATVADDATTTTTDDDGPSPTTTTASGGPTPEACELLTRDDVEDAVGEPVEAGYQASDECWWSTRNDLKTVNVIVREDDLATWRAGYDNSFWVPNGLGDEGYTGVVLDSIVFRVGEVQYEVNVVYSTAGDPDEVVEELAETVASRV